MKIILNGKETEFSKEMIVAQLLDHLNMPRQVTAVAVNGAIVPRDRHEMHAIADGDKIDILRAIGGG